jgi:hypothetical protein
MIFPMTEPAITPELVAKHNLQPHAGWTRGFPESLIP